MSAAAVLQQRWLRHGAGILALGLLVGSVGPYGTFYEMALPLRLLYWLIVVALSWVQWLLLEGLISRWTGWPLQAVGSVTAFLLAALLVGELMLLRPLLGLGGPRDLAELYLWIAGTALVIFWLNYGAIYWAVEVYGRGERDSDAAPSAFLARIPAKIAGELLCVKTEDHYLRIYTTAGDDLILMRLRDALNELEPDDGLQVHRSYWVARRAVTGFKREGRRVLLTLSNGLEVPVSERHLPAVRRAGWLK